MTSALASLAWALHMPPPWLLSYVPLLQRLLNANSSSVVEALNRARTDNSGDLYFVDHSVLPRDEAYEAFICRTGCVPTRENLHDLLNGLVWLRYPKSKRCLNELHAREIARLGIGGTRGALRDAVTLFDENAAVLQAPSALIDALRRRDWQRLFVREREQWGSARLVLFGHALMAKLLQPRKAITAHVWTVNELTDDAVASSLTTERLSKKAFLPLPVLGLPGWWEHNEHPAFYDDVAVFRS